MKSTGIIRRVDDLGRIVIPMELRKTLNIREKDALEIYVENDKIILGKYSPNMACVLTGEVTDQNISFADGKLILSPKGAELLMKEITSNYSHS